MFKGAAPPLPLKFPHSHPSQGANSIPPKRAEGPARFPASGGFRFQVLRAQKGGFP